MKRKLLAMLLSLAMLFTLMPPGVAMAADENTITVGGETLTGSSTQPAYATTDDGGELTQSNESKYNIKWDGETLTLQNATIKSSDVNNQGAPQKACVFALHSYQVKLIGNNELIGASEEREGFA